MVLLTRQQGLHLPTGNLATAYLPWENPLKNVAFHISEMLKCKKDMTEWELLNLGQHIELNTIYALLENPDNQHYFTDGSVDPETGTAGAAAVAVTRSEAGYNETELLLKIDSTVGSMITELVAIKAVLAHCKLIRERRNKVHFYTDFLRAIYAIQNLPPTDNAEIINSIIGDISTLTKDRELHIHWLLSHAGIDFNDKANNVACRARTAGKICTNTPSRSSALTNIKKAIKVLWLDELNYDNKSAWLQHRDINPELTPAKYPTMARNTQVLCTRLKTGGLNYCYRHDETTCDYCQGAYSQFSAHHYLITCPITSKHFLPLREKLTNKEIDLPHDEKGA